MTSIRAKLFDLAPSTERPTKAVIDHLARGQPAVEALRVLQLRRDVVAPPEAAGLVESLVDRFHAAPTSGDHLRLPPPPSSRGPELRASVSRFLDVAEEPVAAPVEALEREHALRQLMSAYRAAFEEILARSQGDG
ncbi:hypothetical protein L6R52_37460 [Myxococcota bacterium]|nr:hypothetical protein [Myxococcota bacterium]